MNQIASVNHYENFPVASVLCPPALRPPIAAIYWFARTADDIADEGTAPADLRLMDLADYRADLIAVLNGEAFSVRWHGVFDGLSKAVAQFKLPGELLHALLNAFEQDVRKTRDGEGYATREELLDYCSKSANPVGRLLLHLYGVTDDHSLAQSDDICSALQLINFWQDVSVDLPRKRFYLPDEDCRKHGIADGRSLRASDTSAVRALIADEVVWAKSLMHSGASLARRVPGRAGWELRFVVQGGLRILRRIELMNFDTLNRRPAIGVSDAIPIFLNAVRM